MDRSTLDEIIAQHDEYLLPLFEPAFKTILDTYAWLARIEQLNTNDYLTEDEWASLRQWQGCSSSQQPIPKEPLKENSSLNVAGPDSSPQTTGPGPSSSKPRPTGNARKTRVKKEKLSICSEIDEATENIASLVVKTEKLDLMAAPTRPAPKARKIKQEKDTSTISTSKRVTRSKAVAKMPVDDDVIIEEAPVETIVLESDSDGKEASNKRDRSEEKDESNDKKRPKSNESAEFRGALPQSSPNATFISNNQANNATFAVSTPIVAQQPITAANLNDLMTDDESDSESPPVSAPASSKHVFNVFKKSPLKKKVEAFEKFAESQLFQPMRVTRTKTRAMVQVEEETKEAAGADVKTKIDHFSTTASQKKTTSALKASQMQYMERERARREKEEKEAVRKREALISEKKRIQKEKAMNELKHRNELLKIEKDNHLKAQRLKAEKEEMEKMMMMKKKALEEKKREEERLRREEEKKAKTLVRAKAALKPDDRRTKAIRTEGIPIYMLTEAPLLPTDDCYDSDDERCDTKKMVFPSWTRSSELRKMQIVGMAIGEKIKNDYFSIQAQTPDLQEIFEVIKKHKLVRRSSANWKKAPRFSLMPPAWVKDD